MNTLTNNFDSIEKIIFEERVRIDAVDIHPELDVMLIVLNTKAVLHQKLSGYSRLKKADKTSLLQLFDGLKNEAGSSLQPVHRAERQGDVKHSLADISKAKQLLGYTPTVSVEDGLRLTFKWYKEQQKA